MRRLTDYSVLTFDCYGTLIDWESGIWAALQPLVSANSPSGLSRDQALHMFNQFEASQQAASPKMSYPGVLECVHHSHANHFGLETSRELDEAFSSSVPSWPAFPDSSEALDLLSRHFSLVILSNVDRAGFAASNAKLGVEFDAIYTAEDIGSYKPDPANFDFMLAHLASDLGHRKQDLIHTAQSVRHDHVPARALGLANVWIDRHRTSQTSDWGEVGSATPFVRTDRIFFSMAEMAAAVKTEVTTARP